MLQDVNRLAILTPCGVQRWPLDDVRFCNEQSALERSAWGPLWTPIVGSNIAPFHNLNFAGNPNQGRLPAVCRIDMFALGGKLTSVRRSQYLPFKTPGLGDDMENQSTPLFVKTYALP